MAFRTINGLSAVVLQYYSRRYGRQQPRLVTDEGELTRLLTQLYMSVSSDYPTESTLKELRTVITYIKNSMLDEEGRRGAGDRACPTCPAFTRRYQAELKRQGWMDYDDQMVYALQILRAVPPVRGLVPAKVPLPLCVGRSPGYLGASSTRSSACWPGNTATCSWWGTRTRASTVSLRGRLAPGPDGV